MSESSPEEKLPSRKGRGGGIESWELVIKGILLVRKRDTDSY